jgi:hypothetical protein
MIKYHHDQGPPGSEVEGWEPDPDKTESRLTGVMLIKL